MNVYKITNTVNNKVYIGATTLSIDRRFSNHKSNVKNNKLKCVSLHKAMIEEGVDNFTIELLETCDTKKKLYKLEQHYIDLYKSNDPQFGYNLTAGGEGAPGRVMSEETKAKISKTNTGRKFTDEQKYKIKGVKSGAFKGYIKCIETGKIYIGAKELEADGYCNVSVYKVINGKLKQHKGKTFIRLPK